MKILLLVTLLIFITTGCTTLRSNSLLAGLLTDSNDPIETHPVILSLKQNGINCVEGDHAARMTAIYCPSHELHKAREIIKNLPPAHRKLIGYFPTP